MKLRLRGRFLKLPTPPTVERRGVPVGLSVLLLLMLLCNFIFILERKNKMSTIYRKINNKALIANKSHLMSYIAD